MPFDPFAMCLRLCLCFLVYFYCTLKWIRCHEFDGKLQFVILKTCVVFKEPLCVNNSTNTKWIIEPTSSLMCEFARRLEKSCQHNILIMMMIDILLEFRSTPILFIWIHFLHLHSIFSFFSVGWAGRRAGGICVWYFLFGYTLSAVQCDWWKYENGMKTIFNKVNRVWNTNDSPRPSQDNSSPYRKMQKICALKTKKKPTQ